MSDKVEVGYQEILNPWFNTILMGIVIVILSIFFYRQEYVFKTRDPLPSFEKLTSEKLKEFSLTQTSVEVGIYIWDIQEFDIIKRSVMVDATIWFIFDPRIISLERMGKFVFEKAEILKRSAPTTRLMPENDYLFASYDVQVRFKPFFNFQDFPFDDHKLNIDLTNRFLSEREVMFTSSRRNIVMEKDIQVSDWECVDQSVYTGFTRETVQKNNEDSVVYKPHVVFSLDYKRVGLLNIISIILPLLIIIFLALYSFSFEEDINMFLSGLIMSLVAYRFVINSMSPVVSSFIASDYIFTFCMVALALVFVANMFPHVMTVRRRKIVNSVIYAALIILFFVLLNPGR